MSEELSMHVMLGVGVVIFRRQNVFLLLRKDKNNVVHCPTSIPASSAAKATSSTPGSAAAAAGEPA